MRNSWVGSVVALALCIGFSCVARAQNSRSGTAESTAKAQPFDVHDLSGVWILRSPYAGLNNHPPPMTAAGQAKFNANRPSFGPRAVPPAQGNDPIGNCDPTGFPRNMFSPSRPVQFIQLPNQLVQIFQYHSVRRTIWTDGRELPKDPDNLSYGWYGYSVGKWDGDTFIANTTGLNEKTWVDHFGYPHSGAMRVEERYRRIDHDTLELVLTIDDPMTYTQPWVSDKKTFKLNPDQELYEEYCVPSEEGNYNDFMRNPAGGK